MTATTTSNALWKDNSKLLEKLDGNEQRWADYQPWLKSLGYDLRPRYQPGWSPSWLTSGLAALSSEDALLPNIHGKIMDATRTRDGRTVALKLVPTDTQELPIWTYLSSPKLKSDPRNHCVPLLDVHPLPDSDDEVLAVMPILVYFHRPSFETLGEIMLCVHTYLEGLAFLHDHHVAHLDICTANVLQDPGKDLFPEGFHPARPTHYFPKQNSSEVAIGTPYTCRTLAPVKFYLIDFGESVRYENFQARRLMNGQVGHDLDVPEFSGDKWYDPFRLDIRAMGDMLKTQLYQVRSKSRLTRMLIFQNRLTTDWKP
ncbi:hypothetical protein SISNIDRAFT_416488 [Sistotremastrum niveocremeum HHB9708]|uniref:Protein kinase domain-containing protein n=1 Tax=Sistotremastrum niveocremeum HHB9708 TaxID=1314777 RepID=A0A164QMD1_9AGAM|nr:hypothetical protein SISNIDRAFT_416488 [Sistotremastrum niveocremeum HHB9708]